jgi:thiamine-monophosphate kinase
MDTSDGVLTTLDQLMRLNNVGFDINCRWEKILSPEVMELCNKTGTPPWMMLAGLHGEFVLLCTIPPDNLEKLRSDPNFEGIDLIHIGKVKQTSGITLNLSSGKKANIDMAPVRNLLQTVNGDLDRYISEFWNIGHAWGLNAPLKQD